MYREHVIKVCVSVTTDACSLETASLNSNRLITLIVIYKKYCLQNQTQLLCLIKHRIEIFSEQSFYVDVERTPKYHDSEALIWRI